MPRHAVDPRPAVALAAVTLLAGLLRLPWLTADGLWFDEVFSVVLASQAPGELLRRALADQTNPPGFYLLLHGWVIIGGLDLAWLRALPAIAGTLVAPATLVLARTLGLPERSGIVAAVLVAASPLLLQMSVEVRAYAPAALLTVIGLASAARLALADVARVRRLVAALAVVNVALVMQHYYGALAVLAQVAAVTVATSRDGGADARRRIGAAAIAALPAAALLGAWLAAVLVGVGEGRVAPNVEWIAHRPAHQAFAALAVASVSAMASPLARLVIAVGCVAAIVAVGWPRYRDLPPAQPLPPRTGHAPHRFVLAAALVPVALALVADRLSERPLLVTRYLIVAVPPLLVVMALALERVPTRARLAAVTLVTGWALAAGPLAMADGWRRPDWARIVTELAHGAPVTLCVNEPFLALPLEYHAIQTGVPATVKDMRTCSAADGRTWAVYRPGTESSLEALTGAGARLGPRLSIDTQFQPTDARPVRWPAR